MWLFKKILAHLILLPIYVLFSPLILVTVILFSLNWVFDWATREIGIDAE